MSLIQSEDIIASLLTWPEFVLHKPFRGGGGGGLIKFSCDRYSVFTKYILSTEVGILFLSSARGIYFLTTC